MLDLHPRQVFDRGNAPGFRPVGNIAVGQQHHGRHEADGDPPGFQGDVETVGGAGGRDHWQRAFAVAAIHGLKQVGLLRLGRQPGAGSTALHVDNDQGKFQHDAQTDPLSLERHAGAAGGGDGHGTAESRPNGGTHGGDFVFRLECADTELLELAQFVQDVTGRSDRVTAQEQFLAAQFRRRHQPPGQRLIAHDVVVRARRQLGRVHAETAGESFRRLAVIPAGSQSFLVGLGDVWPVAELLADEPQRGTQVAAVQPVHESHGEEVPAAIRDLHAQAQLFHGLPREHRHRHAEHVVLVQRGAVERALQRDSPAAVLSRQSCFRSRSGCRPAPDRRYW